MIGPWDPERFAERLRPRLERSGPAQSDFEAQMDAYDAGPLVCGVEDPEGCEACD